MNTQAGVSKHYIIAAGGTGGHLFPAQAVAHGLLAKGHRVSLVTDPRFAGYTKGFEGVEIHTLPTRKTTGGLFAKIMAAAGILRSLFYARGLLKRLAPDAVIGFGGYPSFPTMQAAIWLGIPTLIHEQNKRMGRANRVLARGVKRIAVSFPDTVGVHPAAQQKMVLTGNPVRPAILALYDRAYTLTQTGKKWNLLIFGGSQGARIFSEVVPQAIAALPESLREKLHVVQQARQEDLVKVVQHYTDLRIVAEVKPFFDDMPERLAAAHLVICRSGASTVAEMAMAGLPAIYAPYPYAADNHQQDNADYMSQHQAGWVMSDSQMTPDALSALLQEVLGAPEKLEETSRNARKLALPEAVSQILELVEGLS